MLTGSARGGGGLSCVISLGISALGTIKVSSGRTTGAEVSSGALPIEVVFVTFAFLVQTA